MLRIILFAFVLDLIFGDPYSIPHPIIFIGKLISFLENKLRKTSLNQLFTGGLLVLIVVITCFVVPFGILAAATIIHPLLGFVVHVIMCYQILATHSLKKESMKVYHALINNDLSLARKMVGYIVGRDTQELDEEGVIKAAVETIAENTTDGIITPMLFMFIGGAPLGFVYKGINTIDSMIGYKNEKYLYFGRAGAKLDDLVNFIPARLSALFMIIASGVLRMNFSNSIRVFRRDRFNHKSPNSAQTESVCAGALGIQLAGDAYYFGELHKKPTIGDSLRIIEVKDIRRANRLMYTTSFVGLLIFSGAMFGITGFNKDSITYIIYMML